jgi:hypothetical protein
MEQPKGADEHPARSQRQPGERAAHPTEMHCLRSLSSPVALAAALFASSAHAQTTAPAAAVVPTAGTPTTGGQAVDAETIEPDLDRYCQGHWFAVGACRPGRWTGPKLLFGLDLGVGKMNESGPFGFDTGVGTVTHAGPAWGVRVGAEVLSWLAFEARYVGIYSPVHGPVSPTGTVGFLATGAEGVVRLTAPLPFVHPYLFGGIAYYDVALMGSSEAKAGSVLFSSAQPGIPLGVGVDIPLTWHLSVGFEATYHFMLGENYSNDTTNGIDGGDISTFDAVLRARL